MRVSKANTKKHKVAFFETKQHKIIENINTHVLSTNDQPVASNIWTAGSTGGQFHLGTAPRTARTLTPPRIPPRPPPHPRHQSG